MFVDYSGTKLQVIDSTTGEVLTAELFIAVLGASNFTYAEATWAQSLPDWTGSHIRLQILWRRDGDDRQRQS